MNTKRMAPDYLGSSFDLSNIYEGNSYTLPKPLTQPTNKL